MTNRLNVSIFSFSVNIVASPRFEVDHGRCVGLARSNLTVEYYERDTIVNASGTGNFDTNTRNYFRIRPSISWQWQREWLLSGTYQYAENEQTNGDTATQNSVYLTLTYRPTKIFTSR